MSDPGGKDGLECRGVIFQFNSEAVLFEFTLDGQEEVGMVKPNHLKVRGKPIPANVKKVETLSKYIEVGDEVTCHVVKKKDLKAFKYNEEDDDGEATEIEIQPNWVANEAVKVDGNEEEGAGGSKNGNGGIEKDSEEDKVKNDSVLMPPPPPNIRSVKSKTPSKNSKDDDSKSEENDNKKNEEMEKKAKGKPKEASINDDDILQLEVQLGTEFDEFKNEELDMDGMEVLDELPEGDDYIEEITILDNSKSKEERKRSLPNSDNTTSNKRSKDNSSTNTRAKTPPPPRMSLPTPVKAKSGSPKSKEKPKLPTPVRAQAPQKNSPHPPPIVETPTVQAKVLQLKKPTNTKLQRRVFCGIMEIEDGEHSGKRGFFQTSSTYVWGYHMSQANLLYHIRAGDSFICEVTPAQRDNQDVQLIIKKAWLGIKSEDPQTAADNAEFSAWLVDHCLDEEMFLQWVRDDLPPKPFFPLPSKTYEAVVVLLIRETTNTGDGALARITEEGSLKDSLVLFERDDFYVCGVHVGDADMRFLIRPGDGVSCQVQEVTGREKSKMINKYPKIEEYEFNHIGLLAYVGSKRPKSATLKPTDSMELHRFLDGKGLSVEEFGQMREIKNKESNSKESTPEQGSVEPNQPNVINTSLIPPNIAMMGMMPPRMSGYPAMMNTQTPNYDLVTKCSTLTAKAVLMGSPDNPNIGELVSSMEEIENALFLSKMLTAALLVKMQSNMKAQLAAKYGSNVQSTLTTQAFQITAAETQLLKPNEAPAPMSESVMAAQQKSLETNSTPMPSAAKLLPQPVKSFDQRPIADRTLSALEKQMQAKKGEIKQPEKKQPIKRDMKKLLQSFAASKNPVPKAKSKSSSRFNKEGSPDIIYVDNISATQEKKRKVVEEEKGMSPLELIRKYNIEGKPIVLKNGYMYFGEIDFPKETRTNFKIFRKEELMGAPKEYYTLECLHHFLNNIHLDHVVYVRTALQDNIKVVVRRPDRANLKKYLTGEMSYVLNVENVSHRELNPHLFSLSDIGNAEEPAGDLGKSGVKGAFEYGGRSEYGSVAKEPEPVNKQANDALEQWKAKHLGSGKSTDRETERERERRKEKSRERERGGRDDRDLGDDRHRSYGERDRGESRDRHRDSREKDRDLRGDQERSRPRFDAYDPLNPTKSPPPQDARFEAYDPCKPTTSPKALASNGSGSEQRKSRFDVKDLPVVSQSLKDTISKLSAGLNPFDNRDNPFDNRLQGSGAANPFDNRSANPFDNRNVQSERDRIEVRGRGEEENRSQGNPFDSRNDANPFDSRNKSNPFDSRSEANPFDSRSKSNPFDNRDERNPFDNRQSGFQEEERNPFDNRSDGSSRFDDRSSRGSGKSEDRWNEEGPGSRNYGDRFSGNNQGNDASPWMRNEPNGMNPMFSNEDRGFGLRGNGMNSMGNEDQDYGPNNTRGGGSMNPMSMNANQEMGGGFGNGRMGQTFGRRGGGGGLGNNPMQGNQGRRGGGGANGLGPMFNNY